MPTSIQSWYRSITKLYYSNIFAHNLAAEYKVLEVGLSDQICGTIRYSLWPINEMAHLLVTTKNQRLGCTNAEILCLHTARSTAPIRIDGVGWLFFQQVFPHLCSNCSLYFSFCWVWQKYPTSHQIHEHKVELCSVTPLLLIWLGVMTWGHWAVTGHTVQSANTNCLLCKRITFGGVEVFCGSLPSGKWWAELKPPHFSDYIYIEREHVLYKLWYIAMNMLYIISYITIITLLWYLIKCKEICLVAM